MLIRHIRRSYLRKIIFPALLLAVSLWVSSLLPWQSFFQPVALNPLLPLGPSSSPDTFCQLTTPTLYYSGCDAISDGRIVGYYYYSMHDDFCQLYLLPRSGSAAAPILTSYSLKGLVRNEQAPLYQITNEMAESLQWSQRRILEMMNPYILDATTQSGPFYVFLYALVPLCIAVSLLGLLYFIYFGLFPQRIPPLHRCRRATGIAHIAYILEDELEQPDTVSEETLYLTEHFLINLGDNCYQFQPLEDICWIYIHTTRVFFPFTMDRGAFYFIWWTQSGKRFEVPLGYRDSGLAIMEAVGSRYPEILMGFSRANQDAVKKMINEKKRKKAGNRIQA